MRPAGDAELVQIIDTALADATVRSGHWLACRPGCNQCCTGVFRISALDAKRIRDGLSHLSERDSERAGALRARVAASVEVLAFDFPGDPTTGVLAEDEWALEAFEEFANDAVCPVLDPVTGTCDLYTSRPMTCRTFGPPVRLDEGYGICELCFVGASPEEIAAGELKLPPPELEEALAAEAGPEMSTVIAFALMGR
jgi:Fe-S-cluster containining protein